MRRNSESDSEHATYLRFIEENKRRWGPFSGFLTKFHLKYMEIIDFVEDDQREGLSSFKFLVKYFHMILKSSSMHGTYHMFQVRRHPVEVLLWWFFVFMAGISSIVIILMFWSRYHERPTVMAIERDYMNWNVSFPPLTICATNKINKTALYDYVSTSNATDKRKLANFVRGLVHLTYDTVGNITEYPGITGEEYLRIVEMVTYNLEAEMVTGMNESYPLQRIITEMGICYAFNWDLARYFSPEYFLEGRVPAKLLEYTVSMFDVEKFAFLRDVPYSWEFYTHDLLDIANTRRKLKVPEDTTTFTLLRFNAIPIVSCDCIRELRVKQRMCRYLDESNLSHFPMYTFSLCRIQCKIDAIMESCGCIPFFYKRLPGERYCDWQGLRCVGRNSDRIKRTTTDCDCYQNCEDTKFIVDEFSSAFWSLPNAIRIELSTTKTRLQRNVIYKLSDAIVATGNVCSLFLGVSVLSFVEGIYYYVILLPIRYVQNVRKRNFKFTARRKMAGPEADEKVLQSISEEI